ncbi:MAG: YceD family protein [Lutibacter sp.]
MKDLKEFDISFVGLKEGIHQFDYHIKKSFFEYFNFDDFNDAEVKVVLNFNKAATIFELNFNYSGWVEVTCDVSNELFKLPINLNNELVVKFGNQLNLENESLWVIPHQEFKINIAQPIYESIVLAVPLKKIHPGIENGTLKSEVLEKLKELEYKGEKNNEEVDPRWNKLKNIQIDKNH